MVVRFVRLKMIAVLVALIGLVTMAEAQNPFEPLSASDIRASLFGQRMTGEYPSGKGWAEQFNRDGTSVYVEAGRPAEGLMTFEGRNLCFAYPGTTQTGGCFEVWKRGTNCFDFYAIDNGTTNTRLDDRRFGRSWSARGWLEGKPATCVTEQIS
ncbi:MAG: hypothetical protein AAGK38_10510 [Pseudomonadota bacterium]